MNDYTIGQIAQKLVDCGIINEEQKYSAHKVIDEYFADKIAVFWCIACLGLTTGLVNLLQKGRYATKSRLKTLQ